MTWPRYSNHSTGTNRIQVESIASSPPLPPVQVLYMGLHIVLPLMTQQLLQYPKLCRQYFCLLEHLLAVYPDKMALLPDAAFGPIVRTLQFGLESPVGQGDAIPPTLPSPEC